jgi:hypothetical protein
VPFAIRSNTKVLATSSFNLTRTNSCFLLLPGYNSQTYLYPGNFMNWQNTPCTAFEGSRQIASGALKDVALAAKTALDKGAGNNNPLPVLIFNDTTSEVIELDWRGSTDEFAARFDQLALAQSPQTPEKQAEEPPVDPDTPRGPGRPRLGVVAREVTLLPRHWEWLASQPGGASVALRKLVEVARRASEVKDRVRQASEVGYKFMSTMAGQLAGFEEASRALFAGDQAGFEALIAPWPQDVQAHLQKILKDAFWA